MQTAFITDLRATMVPLAKAGGTSAAISIRYFDHTGRQVGTSVTTAEELATQARAMLAMAEAAVLHAANADGAVRPPYHHFPLPPAGSAAARPPFHHFPMMRDVRVADEPGVAVPAKPSVVIYGPRASGKTFHAELLRKRYECARILDLSGVPGKRRIGSGTLVLTDATKADARARYGRDVLLVSIHDARSAIGVGPVRALAEWRAE
ncbi:hypothetical protein [Sphingomonas hankookensis]